MKTLLDGRLVAMRGDITTMKVDAIINAANSDLLGGGGVDGAIHRAGGPTILEECRRIRREQYPDGMPAGNAVMTGAGRLPCKAVIHTVGPVWSGGAHGEEETLARAYLSSLEAASAAGFHTIAFPAISTGVYGYPRDKAALTARREIGAFLKEHPLPQTVYLVFFGDSDLSAFLDTVAAHGSGG
jgi:O-acetyl-ADP-ribose deacetylase